MSGQGMIDGLLWFALVSSGLMAGLYFAFSVFVMRALATLDPASGMAAMNAINATILRTAFMPLFLASSIACVALVVLGVVDRAAPGAVAMTMGGVAYLIGMVGVTMARNVPLNNRLAAADPADHQGHLLWRLYVDAWTRWNHVRTLASTASLVLFAMALAAR